MPRPGQFKPETGGWLPDRIAVGLLTGAYPPELVDRVVARCGREGRRKRLLTPEVTVYFVLAMCLFPGDGYEEVARKLARGLAWGRRCSAPGQVPSAAAISRARLRLGSEPLEELFAEAARSSAVGADGCTRYRGRRLVAVEGTVLDAPDTAENVAHFGSPVLGGRGYPQVRVVVLAGCGGNVVTAAALGPPSRSEPGLARGLFDRLGRGDLLLADHRGFDGPPLWRAASAGGADLLWRVRPSALLTFRQQLCDGSYLAEFSMASDGRSEPVRVVEERAPGESGRLLTTLLDPGQAPAAELTALHREWGMTATALQQLTADQLGPIRVLRSRCPEGVEQEVWGHLLVHHAIRRLMAFGSVR
ncbi:IS4 family transposase [Streptomyces sp. CBMA156]|uniref:IS4 family transposase n=1 Tax=Streptomyces sp. CBMA156 TaxID=1930280 RepID=UPI001661F98E|nr:IS4 family transposase [Streptomyces sp. CBMA156]MBD0676449.1 hypothetical protein [Streptomyces sp. CBMA156]